MTGIDKIKYAEIGRIMREIPPEEHTSSYEWEELVQKMCASNDAVLQKIGNKERDELDVRTGKR